MGATAGPLPQGYHHVGKTAVIGNGRARFEDAAAKVMRWGMLRGAGVRVEASYRGGRRRLRGAGRPRAAARTGRVVYVIDEEDRRGFAYGTLPGHPESGEELFAVRYDPATGDVHAEVAAFSRHATWWSRLGSPVTSLAQRVITNRYLSAL